MESLIKDCLGLYISVTTDRFWGSPSDSITLTTEIINRSAHTVNIDRVEFAAITMDSSLNVSLKRNVPLTLRSMRVLAASEYSDPYWLKEDHSMGRFKVSDPAMIGKGENDPSIPGIVHARVNGEKIVFNTSAYYRWADPAKGELSRPFAIVPPVFVNIQEQVLIFPDNKAREVTIKLSSSRTDGVKGDLRLNVPKGWKAEPASVPFTLIAGQEDYKKFLIYPSQTESTVALNAEAVVDGKAFSHALHVIAYPHIPTQILLPDATSKLVRLDLKKQGTTIAYVKGAGDAIPSALRTMGYEVWEMKDEEVTSANLARVDAVVLGVRALNVNSRMPFMINTLMEYVKDGGTMVVQYNTRGDFDSGKYAPYKIELSRSRVTEEDSEIRILKPGHPALSSPNKIGPEDFNGWVQERGLNYPEQWDPKYDAVLSMNDTGESPLDGSLLVTRYGEGNYIYTSLSFFRQLPEGVPGAFKLFANLVSLGQEKESTSAKLKTGSD